jgi:YHS domain-containing protein
MKFEFVTPSKDYPLATCVVTGDDLAMGGTPVAIVCDGTEVQFCCNRCVADFRKDPAKYLTMVRRATPSR